MKRTIIQLTKFSNEIKLLASKKKLLIDDFEDLKKELVENPELGPVVPGTGGIRKTRMKSSSKGKSGGFRICYFYDSRNEEIYLMIIYQKNEQENLTSEQKRALKQITEYIKAGKYG